jgi:hypothetical protein
MNRRFSGTAGRVWTLLRGGKSIVLPGRFYVPVQTGPGAHPASYAMGIGSLSLASSTQGGGFDHHPISRTEVKETLTLYFYSILRIHG